ncbi:universal stress protein [Caballeronia sp. 15715]|uniref:universal stress protein n=1 Tax=unclassified Caballeronia TaxID=2646786 RepID=UPI0039E2DE78
MYKRILVALDGSLSANLALEEALRLAQPADAMLMVTYVISHDVRNLADGAIGEEVGGDAGMHWQLDHALELCERSVVKSGVKSGASSGIRCTTQIVDAHGASIPGALMQAALAFEADLIVMGSHGPRGVRRHLIGSVAETILRSSHVPVLTVRDDEHDAALPL